MIDRKLVNFFDWRNGISRIDYFRGTFFRLFVWLLVVVFNFFVSLLFGWDVWADFNENETYLVYLSDPLVAISEFVIFVPWDLRRMKDAGIRWWWIVPIVILESIPEPPAIDGSEFVGHNLAHGVICLIPTFIFGFVLLFKPGRIYKNYIRSKSLQISEDIKVTYSE